jgi:hypothetical protein
MLEEWDRDDRWRSESWFYQFENNVGHLTRLQLDFINWSPVGWDEDDFTNFFAGEILTLPAGRFEMIFPALKVLSVTAVSLKIAGEGLFKALSLYRLSSLTLRHCAGLEEFLTPVIALGQKLSLLSLELVYRLSDHISNLP